MGLYEDRVKRLHDHVMSHQKKAAEPSVAELKALLGEKGIEYDAKAKKEDLIKLLEGAE
jgi:hypothetical protein